MKRLFAVTLILVMCLSLVACGAENEIIGTWRGEVSVLGDTSDMGQHYTYMIFNTDGTITQKMYADGAEYDSFEGVYTLTDGEVKITIADTEMTYSVELSGDKMILGYNGMTQTFERVTE
ncbi:MAG: hypothetical protein IJC86_02335 [Clostridia bacterium]|nr:hypothetical protein [Clostridia bacterium]